MAEIKRMEPLPKLARKKRVAGYCRVSTGKDEQLHSLSAQVGYFNDLIQKHTDWAFAGVFYDENKTGTKEGRSGFQSMLAACREGRVDMVITKSVSRFARNTVTLLETVRELKNLGVDVFFEEQNIHTMSGDGELMLTILASFAQEESRSVSDNLLMTDLPRVIKDCEAARRMLRDFTELDALIEQKVVESETLRGMVRALIDENASTAQSQEEYQKKYDALAKKFDAVVSELDALKKEKDRRVQRDGAIELSIRTTRKSRRVLAEWDDTIWTVMVEKAVVHRDKTITFHFRNGSEITVGA